MSYWTISQMATDADLAARAIACAAQEVDGNPYTWVSEHMLDLAAQPGWSDAWESALAQDPPNPAPGRDPGVITDGQLLSAVQALSAPVDGD